MKFWEWIKAFFTTLFGRVANESGKASVPAGSNSSATGSPSNAGKPTPTPVATPPVKPAARPPTREEVLAVVLDLIEGRRANRLGLAYKLIREDQGKNRAKAIDLLILGQGGELAEPYCQYGQQELIDELCRVYKIDRKKVVIPEGGGTQRVFDTTPEHLKRSVPDALTWITWSYGNGHGHVGMCLAKAQAKLVRTFEFNTSAYGDEIVRDGEGAEYCSRSIEGGKLGSQAVTIRGYIDVYQALVDAWPKPSAEKPKTAPLVIGLAFKSVWAKTVTLPARGRFVCESHYATTDDSFGVKLFPATVTEGISAHLERSFRILKARFPEATMEAVYPPAAGWTRQWTPPESGKAGQGARGNVRPTPDQEMWQGNMMFASGQLPKAGTKFLITNPANGRACVIQMGFEIGPGAQTYLGGVTREVHWYLGASNSTELELAYIVDQAVPLGPVV